MLEPFRTPCDRAAVWRVYQSSWPQLPAREEECFLLGMTISGQNLKISVRVCVTFELSENGYVSWPSCLTKVCRSGGGKTGRGRDLFDLIF